MKQTAKQWITTGLVFVLAAAFVTFAAEAKPPRFAERGLFVPSTHPPVSRITLQK